EGMLMDTLKSDIYSEFNLRMKRRYPINFVNPALKREYGYYFDKEVGGQYFDRLDTARAIVLGQKSSSKANFVQYKFGKGALFILPNPQLFTNYCLLKDDGMDYAAKALSYLPQADQLIWDEHFTRNDVQDKSMLRVFFDNDRLRWAYNLALWGLVIFVLYEMKRRQRIIPVIAHLKNTSVDFVKVVGRVYYQQRNHQDIVAKKITYFWAYIRRKYKLKTTEVNQELMDRLIHVSSASPEVIETLFSAIISFNQGEKISDKQLISLNTLIEKFYEQDQ
ncbi:MAG: DUF4350 domain-containing protein, partial [Pedobacter sp.]|nr:DUF4350 domain-containing protein [Pedobacter sp.]